MCLPFLRFVTSTIEQRAIISQKSLKTKTNLNKIDAQVYFFAATLKLTISTRTDLIAHSVSLCSTFRFAFARVAREISVRDRMGNSWDHSSTTSCQLLARGARSQNHHFSSSSCDSLGRPCSRLRAAEHTYCEPVQFVDKLTR